MMNDKDDNYTDFEKLLYDSDIDIKKVLKEKNNNGVIEKDTKTYKDLKVSLDNLYEKNFDEYFDHKKSGVQTKVYDKFKSLKYKFKDNEILDLHGLTTLQASKTMNIFLKDAYYNKSKYLLVIHGKGLNNSDGVAPLKSLVKKILLSSEIVLAFCSATKNNGGNGASFILLKSA